MDFSRFLLMFMSILIVVMDDNVNYINFPSFFLKKFITAF